MDSITQAVLGASIGEALLGEKIGKKGAILGAVVATIPDLDVVMYLFCDSYEMLRIYRGFSHSILCTLLFAFLVAFSLQRFKCAKSISYFRLWLFSWLTLFTHIILDAFTSYGTQLLLPFSDERVGWDSINVVDPVYTIPLIIGLFCSLYWYKNSEKRHLPNSIGLIVSTFYLLATFGIKSEVNNSFEKDLINNNITYESITTIPVGVAGLNWYGIARNDDFLYLKKISAFLGDKYPIEAFSINDSLLNIIKPEVADEMRWFAKDNYTVVKDGNKLRIYNLQVDMRGVINDGDNNYPTAGYFEISPISNGEFIFSSGSHD